MDMPGDVYMDLADRQPLPARPHPLKADPLVMLHIRRILAATVYGHALYRLDDHAVLRLAAWLIKSGQHEIAPTQSEFFPGYASRPLPRSVSTPGAQRATVVAAQPAFDRNASADWAAYLQTLRRFAQNPAEFAAPKLSTWMQELLEENITRVENLIRTECEGVVIKQKTRSSDTDRLREAFDQYLLERAKRRGRLGSLGLPSSAYIFRTAYEIAFPALQVQKDGDLDKLPSRRRGRAWPPYQRLKYSELHHVWPKELGGPEYEGWNLFPLPPDVHHLVVHGKSYVALVGDKQKIGERIRLY